MADQKQKMVVHGSGSGKIKYGMLVKESFTVYKLGDCTTRWLLRVQKEA